MKGLILAAGEGKRLRPLTKVLPKALITIGGRPLITYQLLTFKKAGISDVGIVIKPQDYFRFKSILKIPDLNIKYIFQKLFLILFNKKKELHNSRIANII